MKKILYLLFIFAFFSCSKDELIDTENLEIETRANSLINNLTIAKGEWESWKEIKIPSEPKNVFTPWNAEYSQSSIPDNIRKDILAEDGWILLRNTLKEDKPKMNYLIFYNQFTGILKGFYYLENPANGNNGFWSISFDSGNQKLLYNHDGYFCYPTNINDKKISVVNIMNLTNNPTKGFSVGWNCFQVELAYDPNQPDITLNIDAFQRNIGSIKIDGVYNSESSGTLITSNTAAYSKDNPFANSNISAVSEAAKDWIVSQFDIEGKSKPIKDVSTATINKIIKGDIKSLIDLGTNYIFSSFLGSATNASNNYTLQFKTSGKIELVGSTSNEQTTAIPPIQIQIKRTEKLGFWNIANSPNISVDDFGRATHYNSSTGSFRIEVNRLLVSDLGILINENIAPYVSYYYKQYSTRGHLPGETYNTYSKTKAKLSIPNNKQIYGATLDYNTFAKVIYDDQKGNVIKSRSNPLYEYYWIYTKYENPTWIHNKFGTPSIPIQYYYEKNQLHMPTEDVKVSLQYTIMVNGKAKEFTSIRTYDPEYIFKTTGVTHPYGWTREEFYAWQQTGRTPYSK